MASWASVDTLAIFAGARAPRKCLLGSLPKPVFFGTKCPIGQVAEPALTGLFLIGASASRAEQMVNVTLGRDDLTHLLLRGPVIGQPVPGFSLDSGRSQSGL